MIEIMHIFGREILDSRGNPSIEVDVKLSNGVIGRASVPSGASTGEHEAVEKRDQDLMRYLGKGVKNVVKSINSEINECLKGVFPLDQRKIDQKLIELDGTINKTRIGANGILGVSLAVSRAASLNNRESLYKYLS